MNVEFNNDEFIIVKLPLHENPAYVLTTALFAVIFILRIILLPLSATYTLDDESTANPIGLLNVALVPLPSCKPGFPEPANVLIVYGISGLLFGVNKRIQLFPVSAIYILF